jgi:hypothetical protein
LVIHAVIAKDVQVLLGGSVLLAALILFASKVALPPYLQPGDFLHVFMALGLIFLSRRARLEAV